MARLDPRLDRTTGTLQILGFWLEEDAPQDADFGDALARGSKRFADMMGAQRVDLCALKPVKLRKHLKERLKE